MFFFEPTFGTEKYKNITEGLIKSLIIFDIDFDKKSNNDIKIKHKYLVSNIIS
uniref:Uncharacterized protein n=1 Tax=viral metagenome TaxID=1070528 RepID=A0A6C0AGM7_9ZZZZ